MFIGDGPGEDEEKEGLPFMGSAGRVLKNAIKQLGLDRTYLTNAVSCRSCAPAYDNEGQPRYWKNRDGTLRAIIRDEPPTTAQVAACLPRLYEEIYLVDPVLIVALGSGAADALAPRTVSIQNDSGSTFTIRIPGAGRRAIITDKKKVWARKVKETLVLPNEQNEVEYLMLPLIHPAFVITKHSDRRWMNPVQTFVQGMKRAALIYDRYMFEVYGSSSPPRELPEDSIQNSIGDPND